MTAIALPRPRRRRSKPAQVAKTAAKAWASMKIGSTAAKTAKKGVKTWSQFKVVKFVGKGGTKLLLIPIAAGGGPRPPVRRRRRAGRHAGPRHAAEDRAGLERRRERRGRAVRPAGRQR